MPPEWGGLCPFWEDKDLNYEIPPGVYLFSVVLSHGNR